MKTVLSFAKRFSGPLWFAAVVIGVYLTRLPSLRYGPGRDPDAWRMLNAAIAFADTGQYTMSRPPGHPVPEHLYSLFTSNPLTLLSLVALIGAVGMAFFALSARRLGCRDFWLAAAAAALTPAVFINGTNVMDYTWALAFSLAAYYFVLSGRLIVAGILAGIAVGCRVTAGIMLIPFSIVILFDRGRIDRDAVIQTVKMWIAATLIGVWCYVPVVLALGIGALWVTGGSVSIGRIIQTVGVNVWGSVGLIALAIALGALIFSLIIKRRKATSIPDSLPRQHVWSWLAVVVVFAIAFSRLPADAGYLIPIVPFVVLLLARYLPRAAFIVFCALLAASPVVGIGKKGFEQGPVVHNMIIRSNLMAIVHQTLGRVRPGSAVMAGWLAPQLQTMWYYRSRGDRTHTVFKLVIPVPMLKTYVESGRIVYILAEPSFHTDPNKMHRLIRLGARPIYLKKPQKKAGGAGSAGSDR